MDGDGRIEVVIALTDKIHAYRWDNTPMWTANISDVSGAAAPSLFDFEGDGKMDVVFGDEQHLFVFDGQTGAEKYRADRNSRTGMEAPVIADVDNDGHADILGVSDAGSGKGIKALSNVGNDWISARRVWNEYAYRVHNVTESVELPFPEPRRWEGARYQAGRCR